MVCMSLSGPAELLNVWESLDNKYSVHALDDVRPSLQGILSQNDSIRARKGILNIIEFSLMYIP